MSNEIAQAFEHPDARSRATGGLHPLDRISLRDHIAEVEIGAFQKERGKTQRICFNIVVEVRPLDRRVDDDVDRILSYDKVSEAIAAELAAERLNLLETLAERIAERILLEPQAERVFVRIEKLDRGPGALGVEIVRARSIGRSMLPHRLQRKGRIRRWSISRTRQLWQSICLDGWINWKQAMRQCCFVLGHLIWQCRKPVMR